MRLTWSQACSVITYSLEGRGEFRGLVSQDMSKSRVYSKHMGSRKPKISQTLHVLRVVFKWRDVGILPFYMYCYYFLELTIHLQSANIAFRWHLANNRIDYRESINRRCYVRMVTPLRQVILASSWHLGIYLSVAWSNQARK